MVNFLSKIVGNNIELFLSLRSDESGEFLFNTFLISGNDAKFFQFLHGESDNFGGSDLMVTSSDSESLVATINMLEGANTDMCSKINFSGDGS